MKEERVVMFIKPGFNAGDKIGTTRIITQYSSEMVKLQGMYVIGIKVNNFEGYDYNIAPGQEGLPTQFWWDKDWIEEVNKVHLLSLGLDNLIEYVLGCRKSQAIYSIITQEIYWIASDIQSRNATIKLTDLELKYFQVYQTSLIIELFKLLRQLTGELK